METEAVFNGPCGNENKTGLNHAINDYSLLNQMSISFYSHVNLRNGINGDRLMRKDNLSKLILI